MRVIQKALTFDDVLLVPAHSTVLPREVRLTSRLTATIQLNIPLLSAAMDTVTESRLAIMLAQEGGIGIVHKNMPPLAQAAEVAKVKRFESGVVKDPITISPTMAVREVAEIPREPRISGQPGPEGPGVVGEGRMDGTLTFPPRGVRGFGYDPIFIPGGHDLTFGEMDPVLKDSISHRALAFAKLKAALID